MALRFFIEAENDRTLRRIHKQPDEADELGLKVRIDGNLERGDLPRPYYPMFYRRR